MKAKVLVLIHDIPLREHSGYLKTWHMAKEYWYWQAMKSDVKAHIRSCDTCQRVNHETSKHANLLQPLFIPPRPRHSISMDFGEGLLTSQKQNVILMVVDRFTKYVHFIPLAHPYTTSRVATLFLQHVLKFHDLDKPSLWVEWLPWVEFWFNTNYQTSTKMTYFEVLYSYLSPTLLKFAPGITRVAMEESFHHRQ